MRYPNGFPGWIDLSTPDQAGATAFYTALFGWSAQEMPTDTGATYTMLSLGDRLVAGLGPQPPEQAQAGVPSTWTTYVMVGDVDEMVTATPGAGGTVLVPAFDVMSSGRIAVVADPSGAMIGLWQPIEHQGADVFNEIGAFSWVDLQSRDLAAALPFYEELFAWRWEQSTVADTPYVVAHLDAKGDRAEGVDTSVAGAMSMPPGVPDEAPSMWGVYFTVAACDDAVAKATELGGSLMVGPMDMDMGRWALVSDPYGAMFYVMSIPTGQA
jgi:predicted enzyme related to lactoylglutathione lyase